MRHIIGIGEMQTSSDPLDLLITFSLGSCLGLTLFDPTTGVGGMIHCMLPLSKSDPERAKERPFMYTDTGVTALLKKVLELGARKKSIICKVAGCSRVLDKKGLFKIGDRNYTICRKLLWKNNILIANEEVGGSIPRTLSLYMEDGRTTVGTRGEEREL